MPIIPSNRSTGTSPSPRAGGGRHGGGGLRAGGLGVPALSRRVFLTDLGRVTLGAVVLGPALVGCSSQDEADGSDGPAASAGTSGVGEGSEPATASGLRWERASYGFVSAFVLVRDGAAVVFDTGTSDGGAGPIEQALTAAGVGWDAVGDVVVSHRHPDHVGGLGAVAAEAPAAAVHAAMPDLEVVRRTVEGASEVVDGDVVLGLRIVATPGHTSGHIAAYDEGSGVLLAGDAVVNGVAIGGTTGEGIEASPPEFTDDAEAAATSVGVLADLRPATILFGHGEPLTEDAAEQLAAAASI